MARLFVGLELLTHRFAAAGQINQCENLHMPFRRRERAMQRFKTVAALQKFVRYHSLIYNHFNYERHPESTQTYKRKRSDALIEWFQICTL